MEAWGIKPFQNDDVLDDIGGFSFSDELVHTMNRRLKSEAYYYSGYEYTALLVSTYHLGAKKQFIIDENKMINIMKTLDKDVLTEEEKDLFHESSKMWISACSIPLGERKELLIQCANKLKNEIDNPKTGNEYFAKDKFILYMKHVYTTAMEILNSVNNKPSYVSKERLERLMKAYDREEKKSSKLIVSCLEKKYEGRKVIAYVIQDEHGRINVVIADALKEAIRKGVVECTNLTLTSDNRLISK